MDELELVSRLREEVPLRTMDRAEQAFLTSIQRPGTCALLARIVQARHGTPRLARRWALPAVPGSAPAGRAIPRRRTAAIIFAAATAAGLAAAGLTLVPGHASLPGKTSLPATASGASPAAAQLLAKVAAAAAAQPNPSVRDSQFVYLKTWGAGSVCTARPSTHSNRATVSVPGDCVAEKLKEAQFWYPVSSLCATGAFRLDGKTTKFSYRAASADPKHFPCAGNMWYPTYRFLQTLPTDPHALLSLIEQQMRKSGETNLYWTFFTIGTLLYNGPPPLVTATLYRAAALIPGVTVAPDATDIAHRPGVSVAYTYQGIRTEWIFSKQTLQYLGSFEINIANGALVSQQAILQRGFVDHAGQIPG